MRKFVLFALSVAVAASGYATTKTVSQTDASADFDTIQAAIDSFTEAEITDGEPDEVVIMGSAEYDEQVVVGGLIPAEGKAAGYLDAAIELAANRDPFTLRGNDPENPPIIDPISIQGVAYGVFTNDPGDNFVASLSYMGKNLTFANLDIRRSAGIQPDQYGVNGQAGNTVFQNVIFQNIDGGESLINFNNAADITAEGFDNSYTFENCVFDGSLDAGVRGETDAIYFHGITDGDAADAGVSTDNIGARVNFVGCTFTQLETLSYIRSREQPNSVTVDGCFVTENGGGFRGSGNGELVVQNSIFYNNLAAEGDVELTAGVIETAGRSGFTPAVTVQNNLFVDNLDETLLGGLLGLSTRSSVILIVNDGNDGLVTIESNTFVNNPIALRFHDAAGREREAVVNNNIFQNSNVAVLTADHPDGSYLTSGTINVDGEAENLQISGEGNIFDSNNVVVEDQDLLPNVNIQGEATAVVFTNASINVENPFEGPPYVATNVEAGADLSVETAVQEFMLY